MTPDERIDAALDAVLKASGSGLRFYTCTHTLSAMREAMRKVMGEAYILGSNTQDRIIKEHYHLVQKAGVFDEKQTRNKTLSAAHDRSLSP